MTVAAPVTWHEANQRYLTATLAIVRNALERHSADTDRITPASADGELEELRHLVTSAGAPPALETLVAVFGLSPFERDVLLICAGIELDARFAAACATAHGDQRRAYPSFSLALAAFPEAHWSALSPAAPLRHWRLIEVDGGETLTTSPLRIDERILHYLAGVEYLDDRLRLLTDPVPASDALPPSHQGLAQRVVQTWSWAGQDAALPLIYLCGDDPPSASCIAATACDALHLTVRSLRSGALPHSLADLETLSRLWEREAALSSLALLLECEDAAEGDPGRELQIRRFVNGTRAALILSGRARRRDMRRPVIALDVRKPSPEEQRSLWRNALGAAAAGLNGHLERLSAQFSLSASTISSAAAEVLMSAGSSGGDDQAASPDELGRTLWDVCAVVSRPRLDELAQRIEPAAGWDDLILPALQQQTLRQIAMHARLRATVYESWGFGSTGAGGLGIAALFSGPSGTGKTMAGEVLATELRLDLYRIDLSQVVSKYIGETEKNLRRTFDAAEEGGAILLFDEADALFGKRSEVRDSHDRYANIEISYLLQRMEAYRGLAILTTNVKSALDQAFLRRLRFVVTFPFPEAAQRAEIWRRIFPAGTPTEGLDPGRLARLTVAGGNIRNIALHAAFLAANDGEPVRMTHVLQAARIEYAKLERLLTEAEIGDWT
jgi:hypothetical protein